MKDEIRMALMRILGMQAQSGAAPHVDREVNAGPIPYYEPHPFPDLQPKEPMPYTPIEPHPFPEIQEKRPIPYEPLEPIQRVDFPEMRPKRRIVPDPNIMRAPQEIDANLVLRRILGMQAQSGAAPPAQKRKTSRERDRRLRERARRLRERERRLREREKSVRRKIKG